jgi:hypothetical protein
VPLPLLVLYGAYGVLLGVAALNAGWLWWERRRAAPPREASARPKVSVLVPARNEESALPRLLASLREQTYSDFEVVVVDDASEDGTGAILERAAQRDDRTRPVRGSGPPEGWLGKPAALHRAATHATGDLFLFLDADARLADPAALERFVLRFERWEESGPAAGTVLSGMPRYTGGGMLLTSLVPFSIFGLLPLPLVPATPFPSLSAMNGPCWMMRAEAYRRERPHEAVRQEVLEDVQIGRLVKRRGLRLAFVDLGREVEVRLYGSLAEAWAGFRKNAYLLLGGRPAPFALLHAGWWTLFVAAPLGLLAAGEWPALAVVWGLKAGIDRMARLPGATSLLAPLSLAVGGAIQAASAWAHARGRVTWKGRAVG